MGCTPEKNSKTPLIQEYLKINPPNNDFYSISFDNGITLNHSNCLYEQYNINFLLNNLVQLKQK